MDNLNTLFQEEPFGVPAGEKQDFFLQHINACSSWHYHRCPAYKKIVDLVFASQSQGRDLEQLPYLPVSLFKTNQLASVPKEEVFKTLTSSGTTGRPPSTIFLDRPTARLQTRALSNIMSSVLGQRRLPMLIIDTKDLIKDRAQFSARGAGVLGMMNFGRDHAHALDENMDIDLNAVQAWLAKHKGSTIFVFGFTFMIWRYFYEQLRKGEVDLSNAILVHSGGWKSLLARAVDNAVFKASLREKTGLSRIHDFYGMVEQVGSIFLECTEGFFHCASFSELLVRNQTNMNKAAIGQEGIVQVFSLLPQSYPGHSLLTEDLGWVAGEDDCRCGWKGKYFRITGRVPRAELRGCSDTHAFDTQD